MWFRMDFFVTFKVAIEITVVGIHKSLGSSLLVNVDIFDGRAPPDTSSYKVGKSCIGIIILRASRDPDLECLMAKVQNV